MKILVIDDNTANLEAAKQQLGAEHELTLCSSYREAEKELTQDSCKFDSPGDSYYGHRWENGQSPYDAVLTDLFLPVSLAGLGEGRAKHDGTEKPYGLVFALAALRRGVKKVAIITNGNHHTDPLLWSLDLIGGYDGDKISIGGSDFLCCFNVIWDGNQYTVKDWKKTLEKLLA